MTRVAETRPPLYRGYPAARMPLPPVAPLHPRVVVGSRSFTRFRHVRNGKVQTAVVGT